MGTIVDGVKTLNSAVRTLLLAVLAVVIGAGGYFGYSEYTKRDRLFKEKEKDLQEATAKVGQLEGELAAMSEQVDSLNTELKEKKAQITKLETAMRLLKTDQRLAQLVVKSIERDEEGNPVTSKLEFVELSPSGEPLSQARSFELPGDVIYIDNWIVKFDDSYIEKGDIERGTSLCLFRRIFSEKQMPTEGFSLDEIGMRPQAYSSGGAISEFEQRLWSEFWEFANDPAKAKSMGIRAANGEAVSIKVREQMVYNISLRSSGGLSIAPMNAVEESAQ